MTTTPIFLFSLPRSGSTLLQRMLGAHSRIATAPEPWILLPQLYALRSEGTYAEYGHRTSVKAVTDLIGRLPNGPADYFCSLREFVLDVYGKAAGPDAAYFLDKTPRYNLIANEILDLFPNASYIVLWRNPLAVVASILETWLAGRWMPYHHKIDLYQGLETLLEAYARQPQRWISLRYEDIVTRPQEELTETLGALDLPWEPAVVERFTDVEVGGTVGDPTGIRTYQQVSSEPLDKWRRTLASPVRKAWCRRYLQWIGSSRLSLMGYQIQDLMAELDEVPSDYGSIAIDMAQTVRGAAWSLLEPDILRGKRARLPDWRRLHSHS